MEKPDPELEPVPELEPGPEHKWITTDQAARANKSQALHKQLYRQVYTFVPQFHIGLPLYRECTGQGNCVWMRNWRETSKDWYSRIEENSALLQASHRLQPSIEVVKAKKRAREVIITLLLVRHRLQIRKQVPREVLLLILGHVNEEECTL